MLKEVSSKSISWKYSSWISSRYPRSSFYQVVFIVISWKSEIIIDRMRLKCFEGINRSPSPLPYVAHYIVDIASFKHAHRRRRRELQSFICKISILLISWNLEHLIVFILCWESSGNSSCLWLPPAVCLCFQAVNFYRPVPRHWFCFRNHQS